MNIKIDASYFSLKCKPTLLRPLNLVQIKTQSLTQGHQQHWQLYFFEHFSQIDHAIIQSKTQIQQLFQKDVIKRLKTAQIKSIDDVQMDQLLQRLKYVLQKCQYYRIKLTSKQLLFGNYGLYQLCQFPQTLKTCILLTEIQKLIFTISTKKQQKQDEIKSTFTQSLLKIAINQIPSILKSLKQNMYIPSADLLQNVLEKYDLCFDESLTMVENMIESKLDLNNAQHIEIYYRILIHKSCSNLKGVCEYLTFTKNLLLDKNSGALAADHETWVSVYETCLRLYARNPEVRQKQWLQIDQILSSGYIDEEFTNFLLTESVEQFSLLSLNFYMENLNKPEQQRLYEVVEAKIMWLLESGRAWEQASFIVHYLDSDSANDRKFQIYNRIIQLVNDIIFSIDTQQLVSNNNSLFDIEVGLTYFIQSMCKNVHITERIFNLGTMSLIAEMLVKGECKVTRDKVILVYRVFVEFIINSFEESDELVSYLEQNQQIVTQTLPQIIMLFQSYNLNLPKQLYKLIFQSASSITQLKPIIWRGIAELYFTQSFQETIDLEMFHSENEAKKIISSNIVELIKQMTINNSKENLVIAECLKQGGQHREEFRAFLLLKSFKDQLIFNNILMMSTYFGQFLPLSQLSQILNEFYTPLVTDIIWKSVQSDGLTILSFLSQELPIDVLKITYKFLKQGYQIDLKSLSSLSLDFWSSYFSGDVQSKIKVILTQRQFRFESYENLHTLKTLELVLNMINCVFDKLNEHSQKSIKQLKVMYEWGAEYIQYLQPNIYGILIQSLARRFVRLSKDYRQQNVDQFQIYNRTKNISVLDLHICGKYHIFQTFHDFNKIGQTIQHQKTIKISSLLHPCFVKQSPQLSTTLNQEQILNSVFQAFVLMENSCLEEVMNDSYLNKVSRMHVQGEGYFQRAHNVLMKLKGRLESNNEQQREFIDFFLRNPLYNRLISHLKLLIGKIYMPYIIRLAFLLPQLQQQHEHSSTRQKNLQLKFSIIRTLVQIIYRLDPLFEQHFAELMQVVEENCGEDEQKRERSSEQKQQQQLGMLSKQQYIKAQILLKTLQMFIECVLSNIKVRSFHIFKLIKLYLSQTSTSIQPFNQVIKFYIDMLFAEFLNQQNYPCFNQEVKLKCHTNHQAMSMKSDKQQTKVRIFQLEKNKAKLIHKVSESLQRNQIQLKDFNVDNLRKLKKQADGEINCCCTEKQNQKSQEQQLTHIDDIPLEFQKLIIKTHNLTTVQLSCTLSMFINLFARLNFPSLPGGIESMLFKQNDKLVYLDYLMELTQKLKVKSCADTISSREMEILSIDVYGNLACVLKGKVTQEILKRFVKLAKLTLQLKLEQETVVTLPIKLLNQRLFSKPPRKLTFSEVNLYEFNQMSKLISEFQQEPLAFDLSIKSHLLKIFPFIKSNLHLCNLQYIVGSGKASVSKKVLQTNHKLIQSILGKNSAKDFIKKYEKQPTKKKQNLQISVLQNAIQEIDKILVKFALIYQSLKQHEEKSVIELYFYFKKICSLIFFVPELMAHILTRRVRVNDKEMTFLEIVFDSLNFTLVLFCKFYIVCLKTNGGFCSVQQLKGIIDQSSERLQQVMQSRMQRLRGKVPLNMVLEIYIKLRLLGVLRYGGCRNSNALRGLSFTIKQSSKFRFRYYKFIKMSVPQHDELIRRVDEQILQVLLNRLNDKRSHNNSNMHHHHNVEGSLVNKLQVMDLCLQHIISSTMVDYAKMRLDEKLREVFYHSQSQYSIKCLITNSNQMSTLRVLVEDDEENQCSSGEGFDIQEVESDTLIQSQDQIISDPLQQVIHVKKHLFKGNVFERLEIVKLLENGNISSLQFSKSKTHSEEFFPMIEVSSDAEMFSTKEMGDLKQWLSLCGCQQQKCWIGSIMLHQLQRSCDKLLNKQNLTFSFEDALYLDPQHTDQLQITVFAISQNSNMSSDCCIEEETSLAEIPVIGNRIGESLLSINDQVKVEDNDKSEGIPQEEGSEEEITQLNNMEGRGCVVGNQLQEEQQVDSEGIFNSNKLGESGFDVKISIVQEKHVNKFKFQENQIGEEMLLIQQNQRNSLLDDQHQKEEENFKQERHKEQEEYMKQEENKDEKQEVKQKKEEKQYEKEKDDPNVKEGQKEKFYANQVKQQHEHDNQQPSCGYQGSIQYISINTLGGVNEQMHLQDISQSQITDIRLQSQTSQIPPQLLTGNRQRIHRYTIDDYTFQQGLQEKKFVQHSLVDSLQTQVLNSNQPVSKQSIFTLIEEYTLNPQVFKVIKYKIKKASNVDLKKVQTITEGEVKDEVEKEMRHRGIYVTVSPRTYEDSPQGSLFSINKFINQSFQIDQSKFYEANFKRCDRKTAQKQKIEKIPKLSYEEWAYFVLIYLIKTHENQLKKKLDTNNTLLQSRNLNDLLIKMLCNRDNLLEFLEVILSLLSFQKGEQAVTFFQTNTKLTDLNSKYSDVFVNLTNVIVNDLVSKLIVNRIGLPVLFKGKWSYQTKKIIRYDCLSFSSETNLTSSRSQGDPLLEVFLRKSIQLIFNQQLSTSTNDDKSTHIDTQQQGFVKSLSDYFKSVQNFQTNQFPYHIIQDTIKLSNINKNKQSLLTINYTSRHPYLSSDRMKISLSQTLLNTMKTSKIQCLPQYNQIFHLMNYLDFQTFSEFLEIIVQKYKPLCEKLLDREISILKRFRKSAYSESMSEDKIAEIYWHMRKSSKSSSSTDHDQKDLEFFAKIISSFSSTIFQKFKDSIFKFGFGREQNKRKQKISCLKKLLMNPTYEHKYKSIKEEIAQNQRQYMMWKLCKSSGILKEDILPVIEKIAASFSQCLKKWQSLFLELEQVFGTQRQEKLILFKQCSEFYKIFLSFQLLLQEQETNIIRTMSNLKTKPSIESSREIGRPGRRKSSISIKIPRGSIVSSLCLFPPSTLTFRSVFRAISPKFNFFSQMIDQSCPEFKIHAKYSTLESKLKYLHQKNKGGDLTIEVKRENIWQDTLTYLSEQIAEKNIKIKFVDQIGIDYGGVKRQWITLIVKELLNPNLGLFELSVNRLAFQPSALSFLIPNHLFHFYKFGILVGKALKENWLLEINFTRSFLKHILGYTLYVEDLQDIDPQTTKSLLWILSNDIGDGDLGIDFIYQFDVLGKKRCIELIENGKEIVVSQDNKKEYVKKLANYKMTEQIRQQSKAFMSGIQKVVPYETLKLFSYKELGIYLAGMPTVDVEEMKKHTRYQNFSPEEESVKWFWQTLAAYSEEEKANFLFFLTGSYKVPYGGFKQHPISINKMPASKDYLPVAHTCFSVIDLPQYTSQQKLGYLLDKAIKQGKGFSVS